MKIVGFVSACLSICVAALPLLSQAQETSKLRPNGQQLPPLSLLPGSETFEPRALKLNKVELRVVAEGAVKAADSNYGYYDCGLINTLSRPIIEQTFLLRNDSASTLEGLHLQMPSTSDLQVLAAVSGKTHAAPQLVAAGMPLPVLLPGRTLTLSVSWKVAGKPAGPINNTVLIVPAGKTTPVAAVEIQATLVPLVVFSTPSVNFGRVRAGQERVAPLTLDLNPRLAPLGSVPKIYCSNPAISILSVPVQEKNKRKSVLLNKEQKEAGLYAYLLTLPADASIGTVSGTLRVAYIQPPVTLGLQPLKANKRNIPLTPLPPTLVAETLNSVSVQISGQVIGDMNATPSSAAFGSVTQGQIATYQVRLAFRDAADMQKMQLNSAVSWLSARLLGPDKKVSRHVTQGGWQTQTLEVILSPDTPLGKLQTQLTLTLPSGQRLVLPVSALVEARKTQRAINYPSK